ncbi:glycosyltransferase [Lysobacter humi (ex Lee et al. 2017)]
MSINSRDYWNTRFQTDWTQNEGPAQTRFFALLAIDAMPGWFKARVRSGRLDVCDWGCAEGEGAALLAEALAVPVTGIDFSAEAIARAQAKFPNVRFEATDWLSREPEPLFDVVFSSNTLEHFHEPWSVFDRIAGFARRYVALMLPYREVDRHPEHFAGFAPDTMPAMRAGWVLVHSSVIDAAQVDPALWPGEQILAIYARPEELEAIRLPLAALHIAADERPGDAGAEPRRVTLDTRAIERRLETMHADLVRAISDDLVRMQDEHGSMLATSTVLQHERDALLERANRAEQFSRWAAQAWGDATEQRQAMESLTEAVTGMETRLSQAISGDIGRMQAAHGELLRTAGELQGQIAQLSAALDDARQQRQRAELDAHASREDRVRMEALMAVSREDRIRAEGEAERLRAALADVQGEMRTLQDHLASRDADLERSRRSVAELEAARSRDQAELVRLRADAQQLGEVLASSSWRLTKPLRFARRLLTHGFGPSERAAFGRWLGGSQAVPLPAGTRTALARKLQPDDTAPHLLPSITVEPQGLPALCAADALPDVFVWAVIDWHFRTQRPQHLARALAGKGHRVFYMSNNFVDAAEPGFSVDDLDGSGRLVQIHLNVPGAPSIYAAQPGEADRDALAASLARLLGWASTCRSVSIVQHPYWTELAQCVPNARLVYDCMDHHAGFGDNKPEVLAAEEALASRSDVVVVTSSWLEEELAGRCRATALIRNATDFEHFREAPAEVYRDPQGRRVIGYIGAIAEWFDVQVIRAIAERHADCALVLVGADTAGVAAQLDGLDNIRFIGEVPYTQLPYWLHGFDVCLLPFRVLPLTLATNPVKVYEYLSAGKAVVATELPEMSQFEGLIATARTPPEFADRVGEALSTPATTEVVDARRAFAAQQTWAHRAEQLDRVVAGIDEPKVSVIVLTYNNLAFTDACLFSVEAYSDYPNLEVIVVDNASSDGTQDYLREWVTKGPNRRIVLNDENLGFSAGNNRGLEAATGDYLVLLNNDTYVTPGWVRTLLGHLRRRPDLGLVGPVTNNIGNEARIEIGYGDMAGMIHAAARHTRAHPGELRRIPVVAFFCVMMSRCVYEAVGGLDEQFGMGFFEDDDYCRRVADAGWYSGCAEDVFVHHHLSASFDQLKAEKKQALFERNKALYEAKWGPWTPHSYRT